MRYGKLLIPMAPFGAIPPGYLSWRGRLLRTFGGLTLTPGVHGYRRANGEMVHDVLEVWEVYALTASARAIGARVLREVALLVAHELGQDYVFLEIDGRVELIDAPGNDISAEEGA